MVFCILAFFAFAFMSIFSAKYRPLAKDAFQCVFKTITLKPCDTGLDDRIKAEVTSSVLKYSPFAAKLVNRHFTTFSWIFVLLTLSSFVYSGYGVYNFYFYGNCDGPVSTGACILNDITGDYGRFSTPQELIAPTNFDGIADGNPNASVTIVEFGCFTCPYTKEAESTVHELLEEYNGSIYYVFKPFPLPNHEYSYETANAVLCAKRQGRHWQLQDEIFREQEACNANGTPTLKNLAQVADLNMDEFNSCLDGNETAAELETYIQQGKESHIYATPTFFINGRPIVGPRPIWEFRQAIEEAR
jgi:glutaredoxin